MVAWLNGCGPELRRPNWEVLGRHIAVRLKRPPLRQASRQGPPEPDRDPRSIIGVNALFTKQEKSPRLLRAPSIFPNILNLQELSGRKNQPANDFDKICLHSLSNS
jgi:hypothetical protein